MLIVGKICISLSLFIIYLQWKTLLDIGIYSAYGGGLKKIWFVMTLEIIRELITLQQLTIEIRRNLKSKLLFISER